MKRREFIRGAATCAAGLAAGLDLFAEQAGKIGATNLMDGVDLSGAKNLGERLAAMTPYLTLNNRILMPIVGLSAGKFDDLKDKNELEAALGLVIFSFFVFFILFNTKLTRDFVSCEFSHLSLSSQLFKASQSFV